MAADKEFLGKSVKVVAVLKVMVIPAWSESSYLWTVQTQNARAFIERIVPRSFLSPIISASPHQLVNTHRIFVKNSEVGEFQCGGISVFLLPLLFCGSLTCIQHLHLLGKGHRELIVIACLFL